MKRKTLWITAVSIVAIILFGTLYYFYLDPNKFNHHYNAHSENNYPDTLREVDVFTGDKAYLLKGKLLDKNYKEQFERLPDTLAEIQFGDVLYCANCDLHNELEDNGEVAVAVNSIAKPYNRELSTYSLYSSARNQKQLNQENKYISEHNRLLAAFLELAELGKAEFPKLTSSSILERQSFDDKYKNYFGAAYTRSIPSPYKEKIVNFLNSSEGQNFEFITYDQRVHSELVRFGSFTGKGKHELALVLGTKPSYQGNHKEKLLVFAENRDGEVYQIYTEDFYDKVLLETVYHDPEERWDDHVYMGGEEKELPSYESIRIKVPNEPDLVYAYNIEFDKMNRFVQIPKSQINREEDEE
ncbi:hypothetical protein [Pedobacter sp. GR22-10]|uniref:hypothetical protein n=1 Tax=Pedobacter sp. GR22-10 TaxID=2994472 RepID=UPI002245E3B3|nr:hypothetical protein [Pedobacter sp. GR22-10]MCX2429847.1 hypothetical protein [Pedobacter sp. GR22-10]